MKITSENARSSLTIGVMEYEMVFYPSLNFTVSVTDEGFCGSYNGAWASLSDLRKFVEQLRACEKKRQGSAVVSSMSPGELELRLKAHDSWGHFLVHYIVGRTVSYPSQITRSVSGAFEIDPFQLPQIVSDFEAMLLPFSSIHT